MIPEEWFESRIAPGGDKHDEYQEVLFGQWGNARARQEIAAGASSGWSLDIDVTALADPAPPSLFLRAGRDGTFRGYGYPGGLHLMYGPRKSGKTMLAYAFAAQVLNAGGHVLWFAFERQQGVRERLALAGATGAALAGFHYREASGMPSAAQVEQLAAGVASAGVALVVFDAFRGLQAAVAPGTSANDGDSVEAVNSRVLVPLQRAGAAVLVIDHQSKAGDGASAFGSERKESMADVVLSVDVKRPFSREAEGWSAVTATADRYGYNDGDSPGYLVMTPGAGIQFREDVPVAATAAAFMTEASTAEANRRRMLDHLREMKVWDAVLHNDDWTMNALASFLAGAEMHAEVKMGKSKWDSLIRGMLVSGALESAFGPRSAKLLRPGPDIPPEAAAWLAEPGVAARLERHHGEVRAVS